MVLRILFVLGLMTTSFADGRMLQSTGSIVDVISSNNNLTLLNTALSNSSLSDVLSPTGSYTIFAPSDSAFLAASSNPIFSRISQPEYTKHLENLLLFHIVMNQTVLSTDLVQGPQTATMANGENITITVDSNVTLSYAGANGTLTNVRVQDPDNTATNGVVHVIDGVLVSSFAFETLQTLLGRLSSEGFSVLAELVGLAFPTGIPELENGGTLTILAPTDTAFGNLGSDTLTSLKDPTNILSLQNTILNHVVLGIVPSPFLTTSSSFTSASNLNLAVSMDGSQIKINNATVVDPDILASNGIVHSIDTVLLGSGAPSAPTPSVPTSPTVPTAVAAPTAPSSNNTTTFLDIVAADPDLSLLNTAIGQSSAADEIATISNVTVFAPINSAFSAVNASLIALLQTAPYAKHLENLLRFHIIEGAVILSSQLQETQVVTMSNKENVTINATADGVNISYASQNGTATVTVVQPDLVASNGVIHTIGGVLLPSFVFTPLTSLLKVPVENYSIIRELIGIAFPNGVPSTSGALTVFVPSDSAFEALGADVLASLRDPANSAKLVTILANHVVNGIIPSTLLAETKSVTTLGGKELNITVGMDDAIMINTAKVLIVDNLALDGILHGIDQVLLVEQAPVSAPVSTPVSIPVSTPSIGPPVASAPVPAPVSPPSPPTASGIKKITMKSVYVAVLATTVFFSLA